MLIRAATAGDIPQMTALAEESQTAAHWSVREYEALFAPEAPARVALVACEAAGVIRGFVIARCGVEEWEIENVVVDPKLRRQGIGRRLMRGVLRQAREDNVATIILEVRESNAAARALYANFGFQEEGRRRAYYRNPEEDAVVLRMTL